MAEFETLEKIFELVNSDALNELTDLFLSDSSAVLAINSTNIKNQTPLHVAAGRLNADCLQVLLDFGADPNVQDLVGRTPVLTLLLKLRECSCEWCKRKAVRCINVLGQFKANMDKGDVNGETPLHLAADGQWPECATALLDNKATVGTHGRKAMLTILLERIPSVIASVFDRSVEVGPGEIHDPDFEVTFDLGVILPATTCFKNESCQNFVAKLVCDKQDTDTTDTFIPRREMGFMYDLVNSAQETVPTVYTTILYHPLVHVFTDIKWKRLQLFYCLHLVVQTLNLAAYTMFLFLLTYYDCPYRMEKVMNHSIHPEWPISAGIQQVNSINQDLNETFGDSIFSTGVLSGGEEMCETSFATTCVAGFVLLCIIYIGSSEMKQAMLDFKFYVRDILNYAQWMTICAVLATIVVALKSKSKLYFWVYPVAGFGMGMSWVQIFIQVGRLPLFSIYIDMFVKVTLRFCSSLLIYSGILIAFALSYCILFPLEPKFTDIPLAILRMLTMMVGELDYNGLFSGANKSPITSHVWYACFIVLVTLILMNLLVGLAVNDIQKCKKHAEIFVIKRRIRYLWFLEKSFFLGTYFVPCKPIRTYLRKAISVLVPNGEKVEFMNKRRTRALFNGYYKVRPNDPSDASLTKETRYCIKQWLERRPVELQASGSYCKKRIQQLQFDKSFLSKRRIPTTKQEFEGPNVKKTRVYSTPPKGSWSETVTNDQESKSLSKLNCNIARMERKLEEIEIKLDSFLRSFNSIRRGEN